MKDVVKRWPIGSLGRLWIGPSLDYKTRLWLDVFGNSYSSASSTLASRKRIARRLRQIADELEAWK